MNPFDWPKHPDGSNLTIGEMTPEDQEKFLTEATRRFRLDLQSPGMQAKLAAILRGERVDQ